MVGCKHITLCKACAPAVSAHARGSSDRAFKLSRLMCPICRGFELEEGASAESIFEIIDLDKSGTIDSGELLLHLLVAGQEPETVAELFRSMDTNQDGLITLDEWREGFSAFLSLAHGVPTGGVPSTPPAAAPPPAAAAAVEAAAVMAEEEHAAPAGDDGASAGADPAPAPAPAAASASQASAPSAADPATPREVAINVSTPRNEEPADGVGELVGGVSSSLPIQPE